MKYRPRKEKINKNKRWLFENILKTDKALARLIKKKKGRGSKSIRLKMKMENLQWTQQKFEGSYYYQKQPYIQKWTIWKKWTNSQKGTIPQD